MDPLVPLFAFIVTIFIYITVQSNISYHKSLKERKTNRFIDDETDEEWIDRQW